MYILARETSRSRATQLRSPRDRLVASLHEVEHQLLIMRAVHGSCWRHANNQGATRKTKAPREKLKRHANN